MTSRRHSGVEMEHLDFDSGWQPLPGFAGLCVKVLSDDLNETERTGGRTRLIRFSPGASTHVALVHDYWEEMFVLHGDINSTGVSRSGVATAHAYSCRPPRTPHGPFTSESGCILLELQYFAAADAGA